MSAKVAQLLGCCMYGINQQHFFISHFDFRTETRETCTLARTEIAFSEDPWPKTLESSCGDMTQGCQQLQHTLVTILNFASSLVNLLSNIVVSQVTVQSLVTYEIGGQYFLVKLNFDRNHVSISFYATYCRSFSVQPFHQNNPWLLPVKYLVT